MRVCLFGGSFDPVHLAHVEITNKLLEMYDEVWIIVAYSSPFKSTHYASFEQRFEMCNLVFNDPRIKVLDIENKEKFKYSFDTVNYLTQNYDHQFYFAIGADNALSLTKWHNYDQLSKLVEFVVFSRREIIIDNEVINFSSSISSSRVRITKDSEIESVNDYIQEHNLYHHEYEDDFKSLELAVNQKRYIHSVNVFNLIKKLATIHNLDIHKCCIAAIYHDFYKTYVNEFVISEFKTKHSEYQNYPDALMHGVIMSHELNRFGIDDDDIKMAIKYHTTGYDDACDTLKALYIADYCEEGRKYRKEVIDILNLAFEDLDLAYNRALKERSKWVIENIGMHPDVYALIKNTMEE